MLVRLLYAALFCIALPSLLWAWATALDRGVAMPIVMSKPVGSVLSAMGLTLMLSAMWSLWIHGGGLPMNAFPPSRFVSRGPYALVSHPIYVGFVFACAGVSVCFGSPAGVWIVTPVVALGCWALVAGYERTAIASRFGQARVSPRFSLPPATDERPAAWDFASAIVLMFLPWLVAYEGLGHIPVPGAIESYAPFEHGWPVWTWTETVYLSTYPWTLFAIFACRSRRELREFCVQGLIATAAGAMCYLCLPIVAPPRAFVGDGLWETLLAWERADGLEGRASMPSFHVFWALTSARQYARRWPSVAWAFWGWGLAIAVSCVTTGMHSVADVASGMVFAFLTWRSRKIWRGILLASERVANSWYEWHVGPIRIIVHGLYAGLAAFVGMFMLGTLLGEDALPWLALVAFAGMVGAALWGQALEGAAVSLRPFGYYGHIIGVAIAVITLMIGGVLDGRSAAALAVAAPWIQALGRLRCLVQGCCHGRAIEYHSGITYTHPMSRACRAGLSGVRVHATPVYSIVANVVLGLLLVRLWMAGASSGFVAGTYLMLSGITRFAEEHYRGEPQTGTHWGLRTYQWLAIASMLLGMAASVVPGPNVGGVDWNWSSLMWSLGVGTAYFVAMGVDVPDSNRRFSRLA